MAVLYSVIMPVFLVIGFGYVAAWRGWFTDQAVDGVMTFAQTFAIPCLLFTAISTIDLSQSFDGVLLGSFYAGAIGGFTVGLLGARFLFQREWEDAVAIGFIGLFSNSVLLGLPITERAYGADALDANFAIIAIHSPTCYFIGITAMEIARSRGGPMKDLAGQVLNAMFHNPLILAIVLGFAVNLSGIALPVVMTDAVEMLVRAAIPAAIFGMGGVLYRYRPEGDMATIFAIISVSLILHPVIVWTLGRAGGLSEEAFRSAVLTASMAPGVNCYIFANMYGRARRVAASAVLIGTGMSMLTVWGWLAILG